MAQGYYDDQACYDEYGYDEYGPSQQSGALGEQLKATPWWLISIAFHAVLLMIFSIIVTSSKKFDMTVQIETEVAESEPEPFEPEPREIIPNDMQIEREDDPIPDPVEDPCILENAQDDANEDATNDPNDTLAPNQNPSDDNWESPFTGAGFNDAIGIGGNRGGGHGGMGERGGMRFRRSRGGRSINQEANTAVDLGLEWLKRHQSEDGSWSAANYMNECDSSLGATCTGAGWQSVDVGVSGLATLAFLGAGFTHNDGKYRRTVKNAIRYLIRVQDADGCYGPREDQHFVYNHSCAQMAIAEALAMTQSSLLRPPAEAGARFVVDAQNPGLGWRYGVKPCDNDSSVTGWMVLALKSSLMAGCEFPTSCYEGAREWYRQTTDPSYGRVGYTAMGTGCARLTGAEGFDRTEALTAVAMIARLFMGDSRDAPDLRLGAQALMEDLPVWENSKLDYYYWYYGSLALFQMGGRYWERWEEAMRTTLVEHQNMDGCQRGSWDPIDAWSAAGGRVYATALNALTLEVYYRYEYLGTNVRSGGHK